MKIDFAYNQFHMRILLLCTIFLISPFLAFSGNNPYYPMLRPHWEKVETIDSAFVRVLYNMYFPSAEHPDSVYVDLRTVEIGKRLTKDYSHLMEDWENEARSLVDKGRLFSGSGDRPVYPMETFLKKDGKTMQIFKTDYPGPILKWETPSTDISWRLIPETDSICGYPCQKAVCEFSGRKYTAWFTFEIPVDGGPYRFRGLPGLILKIEDATGTYRWEAAGIETGKWPIYLKHYLFQKCSRQNARKTLEMMFVHPNAWSRSLGVEIFYVDPETRKRREPTEEELNKTYHYDPIELE